MCRAVEEGTTAAEREKTHKTREWYSKTKQNNNLKKGRSHTLTQK
jgi:hypothetical protein